jgi:hypothetical protein
MDSCSQDMFSASPLHCISLRSDIDRNVFLAILSSRVAFWLWHVEGDGFHVTADFLRRLPLWRIGSIETYKPRLAQLGIQAWSQALKTRVRSVNGGKATYSFHCPFETAVVNEIDHLLLSATSSPNTYFTAISDFVTSTVSIDGSARRLRQKLIN